MIQKNEIIKCDRCGERCDNVYNLKMEDGNVNLCDHCYTRFKKWWNAYLRPDPGSSNLPFNPNEKIMYKNNYGVIK